MPTIQIKSGDTLSQIAARQGTTVSDIMTANKGNPSVRSADRIVAGGTLNLPEKSGGAPTTPGEETPAGTLPSIGGPTAPGPLGNLRLALRSAAEEAGKKRIAGRLEQFGEAGLGKTPGTLGDIANIIKRSVQPTVQQTFSDVMKAYEEANEAKKKELDRINELRLEFGSVVPSNITDLTTALDLVAPLVDKERKLRLDKLLQDQQGDNDIESAAEFVANGGSLSQIGGNADYKAKVRIRANEIREELEVKKIQEEKDLIAFRIERKISTYETERSQYAVDERLTAEERRMMIDYIDSLEQSKKASKASKASEGEKDFFSRFREATDPVVNRLFGQEE